MQHCRTQEECARLHEKLEQVSKELRRYQEERTTLNAELRALKEEYSRSLQDKVCCIIVDTAS